ncbi:tRNA dihydrouridine(20/20a) synthase DusA [Alteromonas sp. 5E99-2]|uniref:tRNA dihydrouridine(20/20a) synthase DusA n=1 Tax=Alteromonas sp. 5E99-2 TaxID=2817683 RepID=UPI001A99DB3A|nr:tRNA dihydrouridine(20/20a) synthase DusA [Alteromonas sp. 5E99-2]MBO1254486.1 tRNA dihydrouridine(20/20a) synthase DusA [Alteromonas sp. 5E99-2]
MTSSSINRTFSVAPMLDWTDRHCRYFYRLMTKQTLLYTEMVTTGAIIFGKGDYLGYNNEEHPVALQLGGSDIEAMTKCAVIAQERGYDEVNINVGCPSDRVQNGMFGACLMANAELVGQNVSAMQREVDIPVTVKCRIGIDEMDEDRDFQHFIQTVADAGCNTFIVHARKAWLQGLSPKQNRDVPPLNYPRVYGLKENMPHLHVSINGGVTSIEQAKEHLRHVDGVMMGREVYSNPYILSQVDRELFTCSNYSCASRDDIVLQMNDYIQRQGDEWFRPWHAIRHMLGLYQGEPGGKVWRRYLSENGTGKNARPNVLIESLAVVKEAREKVVKI